MLEKPDTSQAKTIELTINEAPTQAGYIYVRIAGTQVRIDFLARAELESIYTALAQAINEEIDLPVVAESAADKLTIKTKWDDTSANQIQVSGLLYSENAKMTLQETQAIGTINLDKAFDHMGHTWYTLGVTAITDTEQLQEAAKLAEARMDSALHMPMLVVAGSVQGYADFNNTVKNIDSIAMQVVCVPGSTTMPGVIAADEVYKRIMCSQSQPNLSGRNMALRYTQPGSEEFTASKKEAVVKNGGSTITILGGAVYVDNDATTSKTVNGKKNDIWRWASTVLNYMAKVYSLKTMLTQAPFDDYIIMNDTAVTSSPKVVKPSTVKQYMSTLMQKWVDQGLSKNLDDMLESIKVSIPQGNVQSYLIEYKDDMAVAGKHIFVYNSPIISSKV